MTNAKIMIIDDDKDFLDELRESLSLGGYEVSAFTDGAAAVNAASRIQPDLVILDLKMRGKNGFQVAEEMKLREGMEEIPIIAMTGYFTRAEDETHMKACGISLCLIKPFTENVVKHKVALLLSGRG